MLTQILLLICAALFLYSAYCYAVARPLGFPPDFKYLHKGVLKFSKWYNSDIVGFFMGSFPVVAVHNAKAFKDVLFNKDFDGRPQIFLSELRSPGKGIEGIFFKEGIEWKEQRRFILRHLRDFGFGRRFVQLEFIIKEEIADMLDLIRNGPRYDHENQVVDLEGYRILLPMALNPTVCNSYFHIMLNERFHRSDQANMYDLIRAGMVFQRKGDDYGKMLSIMPWIRHIFPKWSSYKQLKESTEFTYNYFKKIVYDHLETYDENSERNFVDIYLREMLGQNNAEQHGFSTQQFIMALVDFAFPAFTAVGTQISLIIQYLILYPEVNKRIQHEIDDVVGQGRLPSLEDRQFMPFSEATIREGLRIQTLVPSDIPHKALVNTSLMGYTIPKDTIVIPSLYAYHMDKRVWGDPDKFRPDRFLEANGNLNLKLDISFPFGAGKRLCAGETFARNMLFLMLTALCQNFNFVLKAGDPIPDPSKNLSGIIISPPDFWLQLEERKT